MISESEDLNKKFKILTVEDYDTLLTGMFPK